jgi:hypothetical protein
MSYFEYLCESNDHSHRLSTDINVSSKRRLKCKFCGKQMQKVEFGFKKEKFDAVKENQN